MALARSVFAVGVNMRASVMYGLIISAFWDLAARHPAAGALAHVPEAGLGLVAARSHLVVGDGRHRQWVRTRAQNELSRAVNQRQKNVTQAVDEGDAEGHHRNDDERADHVGDR